jgi:hypothetical protein
MNKPTKRLARFRRPKIAALAALSAVAVVVAVVGLAGASSNLPPSTFEINDGNLVPVGGSADDWTTAPHFAVGVDAQQSSADDAFKGGAKHDQPCPTADAGSIPPNKDDLTRLYVGSEETSSQMFVYMAWERFLTKESSASAHMGFEFNQGTTPCGGDSKNVVRTAGDMLILYDLEGGGKPSFELLRWITSGSASQCKAASSVPCWGNGLALGGTSADGSINTTAPIVDPITVGAQTASRTLGFKHMFGEAAVNLTAAGVFDEGDCAAFGTAQLGSRSSGNSFVSTEKDFVGPIPIDLQNCGSITVKKETTPDEDPNSTDFGFTTTNLTPSSFSIKDDGSKAYPDLNSDTYSITEDDPTPGYNLKSITCSGDTDSTITKDLAARKVTIDLVVPEDIECTFNNEKPGKVIVEKQTAPDGLTTSFGFTPSSSLDSAQTVFNLSDGGTKEYPNLSPGTYTVAENAATGYVLDTLTCDDSNSTGSTATRTATFIVAAGETVKCTFTNRQTHRVVVIVCHEGTDKLAPSDVTYGADTKTSLAAGTLTDAQQKTLCDTDGATFGGKAHGSASLSVDVGSDAHP